MALVCFFCLISTLYACLLVNCSPIFKLLYNSLNFQAKINLNTTRHLIWTIFMALRPNLFLTVYTNTLQLIYSPLTESKKKPCTKMISNTNTILECIKNIFCHPIHHLALDIYHAGSQVKQSGQTIRASCQSKSGQVL